MHKTQTELSRWSNDEGNDNQSDMQKNDYDEQGKDSEEEEVEKETNNTESYNNRNSSTTRSLNIDEDGD